MPDRPEFRILPKENALFDIARPRQRSFLPPKGDVSGRFPKRELPQPKDKGLPMDNFIPPAEETEE